MEHDGEFMAARGDFLIKKLIGSSYKEAANDLLIEFQLGYPIEKLRSLLESKDEDIVKAAVWIASELGQKSKPIFDAITPLLHHELRYVRFFAIDVVLTCATAGSGAAAIADVISMLDDADPAVRWKVLSFLARASSDQIISAKQFLKTDIENEMVSWFLVVENEEMDATDHILEMLESKVFVQRAFAAAAAIRKSKKYPELLIAVTNSSDKELSSFASDF